LQATAVGSTQNFPTVWNEPVTKSNLSYHTSIADGHSLGLYIENSSLGSVWAGILQLKVSMFPGVVMVTWPFSVPTEVTVASSSAAKTTCAKSSTTARTILIPSPFGLR